MDRKTSKNRYKVENIVKKSAKNRSFSAKNRPKIGQKSVIFGQKSAKIGQKSAKNRVFRDISGHFGTKKDPCTRSCALLTETLDSPCYRPSPEKPGKLLKYQKMAQKKGQKKGQK